MENKAQIDQIIEQSTTLIELGEFDKAKVILEEAFKMDPSRIDVIDLISDVYFNLDNLEGSMKMIKKSISMDPENNPQKYMTFAQMLSDPNEAFQSYQKGIELYIKQLQSTPSDIGIKAQIARGYSSIAELFMNSKLCEEKNAEETVENALKEALKYDPKSIDALFQLSNLRIIRERDEEAETVLNNIYNINKKTDENDDNFPDHDMLMNISKNFAEINLFEKATEILDIMIKMDDEDLEGWYLLAFYHYQLKNYQYSMKCLKRFNKIQMKMKKEDKTPLILEFIDAAKVLLNSLNSTGINLTNQQNEEEEETKDEKENEDEEMN